MEGAVALKKWPMLVKLFAAIAFFLIIPLMIAGVVFNYNMIGFSEREISKSVINNLKTVRRLNDVLVEAISRDTIRLSLNTALDEIKEIHDYKLVKTDIEHVIRLSRVQSALRETFNSNHRLHSVYVYLEEANYIITSGEEGVVLKSDFADQDWIRAYDEKKDESTGTIWINSRRARTGYSSSGSSSRVNVITYLLPLKNLSLQTRGAIVVNIREDELSKLMNSANITGNGYVFIIDSQGNVISHMDKKLVCENIFMEPYIRKIVELKANEGYILDTIDKKKQIVAYHKTDFNGWIYVGVFSLDNLMDKADTLRTRIMVLLVLIIIFGVTMSYIIAKRIYNPLKTLIQDVKKRKGIDLKDAENEMALLSRAFAAIERQEEDLKEILEKNKKTIEERYLIHLLKGEEENSAVSSGGVEFPYRYFLCVVLSIDRFDKFLGKYAQDQQYFLKMLIIKVCEEIIGEAYKCGGVLYDTNTLVLLVNCEETEQVVKNMKKSMQRAQDEIYKVLDNKVTVAVGDCRPGAENIPSSFARALETVKQRLIYGHGKIIVWEDTIIEENKYFYPYTYEKHIFNNLNLGLKEETLAAVRDLTGEIRSRSSLSPDNILQVFMQLAGNTVKFLVDNNINLSDVFGNDYNIYQKLSTKETLDDIELWLVGFYTGIINFPRKSVNGKNHTDCVFNFIQSNYKKDIDVTAIADDAGISYSYVRKIIKDRTGKTMVDYVNGLRIEEAKRLLRQTDQNILEIALQVGYNNDQSFNRFFKKYEGVTPGEFRNIS